MAVCALKSTVTHMYIINSSKLQSPQAEMLNDSGAYCKIYDKMEKLMINKKILTLLFALAVGAIVQAKKFIVGTTNPKLQWVAIYDENPSEIDEGGKEVRAPWAFLKRWEKLKKTTYVSVATIKIKESDWKKINTPMLYLGTSKSPGLWIKDKEGLFWKDLTTGIQTNEKILVREIKEQHPDDLEIAEEMFKHEFLMRAKPTKAKAETGTAYLLKKMPNYPGAKSPRKIKPPLQLPGETKEEWEKRAIAELEAQSKARARRLREGSFSQAA